MSWSHSADKDRFLECFHFQIGKMLITEICELATVLLKTSFGPFFPQSLCSTREAQQLALIM